MAALLEKCFVALRIFWINRLISINSIIPINLIILIALSDKRGEKAAYCNYKLTSEANTC